MAYREIPEGSVEIQTGLWAKEFSVTIGSITKVGHKLYSAEGYCFYNLQQPENYDEEGNLLPLDQLVYATYSSTSYSTIEELNANYVSVPYQEGYEVVSAGNKPVTS